MVSLCLDEIDAVFQQLEISHPGFSDTPDVVFLNTTNGKLVKPGSDEEIDQCLIADQLISFPKSNGTSLDRYALILDFIDTIEDGGLRITLDRLVKGRGAIRRFKDYIYIKASDELRIAWLDFERENRLDAIVRWLEEHNIDFIWDK